MYRALNLVLVAWAGSLWTICCIVAPSLFAELADRHLAGQVAGYFFRLETWISVGLGAVAMLLLSRRAAPWVTHLDYGLLATTVLAPLISELGLRPLMDSARAADNMARFGMLHGASALLFALACITVMLLVWRISPAK